MEMDDNFGARPEIHLAKTGNRFNDLRPSIVAVAVTRSDFQASGGSGFAPASAFRVPSASFRPFRRPGASRHG